MRPWRISVRSDRRHPEFVRTHSAEVAFAHRITDFRDERLSILPALRAGHFADLHHLLVYGNDEGLGCVVVGAEIRRG